ncbi:arsenate reductase family protein [Winogradskyella litorisediminis]|uniref:Arsenate reductase family protein n=1 Tax=Winogradskyella litorisediminis TaxID=1156618 RepID=A0ABW3N5F0_9FLAO
MIYIFSDDSRLGRKGLEIVEALDLPIRVVNINKDSLSNIIWLEIVAMLNCELKTIFNIDSELKIEGLDADNFVKADYLNLVKENPSILKNPIAIKGSEVLRIFDKKEIFQFYSEIKSEETFYNVSLQQTQKINKPLRAI